MLRPVKVNIAIIIILYASFFSAMHSFAQDKTDTLKKIPFDKNKIKESVYLSPASDTISYSNYYLWNDKRTLSELLNERSGYFVNNFGMGGRNVINFHGLEESNIGIFRDGIQMNDIYFGGFDVENISINEIDKIEEVSPVSSFLYGINSQGRSINIITKEYFRQLPFSQLRYTQDRTESMNADFFFSLPISKKVNFLIGANNHSTDGRYANSDFAVWRARGKLSYYPTDKFNLKANFYFTNIQRGLNEGLKNNTEDTLSDPQLAAVNNPDSYERLYNYYYNVSAAARLFKDTNSITILNLYSSNSMRLYRDEENRLNPNGIYVSSNYHSIQYALDLKQNIFHKFGDMFNNFSAGVSVRKNINEIYDISNTFAEDFNNYSAYSRYDINYGKSTLSGFAKYEEGQNYYSLGTGGEAKINFYGNNDYDFGIKTGINHIRNTYEYRELYSTYYNDYIGFYYNPKKNNTYFEMGVYSVYKSVSLDFSLHEYSSNEYDSRTGLSAKVELNSDNFTGYLNIDTYEDIYFPGLAIKSDFAYQDYFFKNKLRLKVGVNSKYYSDYSAPLYSQRYYNIAGSSLPKTNVFNLDFYLGARIGKANINLTIANIFNRLNYDTGIYPYDDRGGLINSISRFTIVWDFLN